MSRYDPPPSPSYSLRVRAASPWRSSTPRSSRPPTPMMGSIPLPRTGEAQVHPASDGRGGAMRAISPPIRRRTVSSARVASASPATRPTTPFRAVTPFRTVTPAPSRATTPSCPAALRPEPLLATGGVLSRLWDMRRTVALSVSDLARPATSPRVARLRVCVGPWVFPVSISPGEAYVTVGAVLAALQALLASAIAPGEWSNLHGEMRSNAMAQWCPSGVLPRKVDAFGRDTQFAGLRPSRHSVDLLVLQTAGGLL